MNSVQEKIKSIVEGMGVSFTYATLTQAELSIADSGMPVCVYVPPLAGSFSNASTQYKDSPNCVLLFADLIGVDITEAQRARVIERVKTLSMIFMEKFNNSGLFKPVYGKVVYQVHPTLYQNSMAGLALTFIPEETAGIYPDGLDEKLSSLG